MVHCHYHFSHAFFAVTPYNISYLEGVVRTGPYTHPGTHYFVCDTGEHRCRSLFCYKIADHPHMQICLITNLLAILHDFQITISQPATVMMFYLPTVTFHMTFGQVPPKSSTQGTPRFASAVKALRLVWSIAIFKGNKYLDSLHTHTCVPQHFLHINVNVNLRIYQLRRE